MIAPVLTDGLIDEMECMVLKEAAYASVIIEGDVYTQQKEVEAIPVFTETNRHKMLWQGIGLLSDLDYSQKTSFQSMTHPSNSVIERIFGVPAE